MSRRNSALVAGLGVASALLVSLAALADLPPADGRKYVSYGFRVEGMPAFPDQVLLAFPWSLSGGRPTEEHARLEDGKVLSIGRRSGATRLYAMKRADYETWLASYEPAADNYQDPALRTLFASSRVRPCDVAPTAVHEIATDDARNEVVEVLRAVSIDDARCHLESTAAAAAPSVGVDASKQTKAGGCAGCHAAGATGSLGGVLAAVLAALMVHRRRRSRAVV